jgi:hypothetical protein
MGLVYERRSDANTTAMALEGWTDSDFAPNYGDGYGNYRSTSGHLFPYNNTPVQWASRRQDLLAMGAHEAEIYAAVDAAKEAVRLHRLLQDLGEHSTAAQVLMGDNKPSATGQQNFTDCTQSIAYRQARSLHQTSLPCKEVELQTHSRPGEHSRCVYKSTSRYNIQEIQTQHEHSMKLTGLSGTTTQKAPVTRM